MILLLYKIRPQNIPVVISNLLGAIRLQGYLYSTYHSTVECIAFQCLAPYRTNFHQGQKNTLGGNTELYGPLCGPTLRSCGVCWPIMRPFCRFLASFEILDIVKNRETLQKEEIMTKSPFNTLCFLLRGDGYRTTQKWKDTQFEDILVHHLFLPPIYTVQCSLVRYEG